MATTTRFSIGSISFGTLLTSDLLEVFTDELEELAPSNPLVIQGRLLMSMERDSLDDNDDAQFVLEELTDALKEFCPPFVSFGAHPGDSADFGFWPDHDALEDALRYGEETDDKDTKFLPEEGLYVHVSDHGNISVYDQDRKLLWDCV